MGKVTGVITPTSGVMGPYLQLAGASLLHLSLIQPPEKWRLEDDPFLLGWYIFRAHVKLPGLWDWLVLGLLFTTCYAYLHYLAMIVAMCRAPAEYQVPKMKVLKVSRSLVFAHVFFHDVMCLFYQFKLAGLMSSCLVSNILSTWN